MRFDTLIREQLKLASPSTDYTIDCFVSSELAYNDVLQRCLPKPGRAGGAYLGVGPDQNYTYVANLRPSLAVILDARLDNLLEHLIFKVLFNEAKDPLDYLCLLLGRRRPLATLAGDISAPELLAHLRTAAEDADSAATVRNRVRAAFAERWSDAPHLLKRVDRILSEFCRRQLNVTSVSERCLANLDKIPDFSEVISSTTAEGFNLHYLTGLERFQVVKALHAADRIVPMLGNVTDPAAIARARRVVEEASLRFDTVYLSNLEEFLLQRYVIEGDVITARPNPNGMLVEPFARGWHALVDQLEALPRTDDALLIRFFFPGAHRGRQMGIFPWLSAHVAFIDDFLRRVRNERPTSVMATYV
jgi:hypothetical protein